MGVFNASIVSPRLKLAAFIRGGNSLNVLIKLPTYAVAGSNKNTWSKYQITRVFSFFWQILSLQ